MLEVTGLCAGYGRVQVLWDVDLIVKPRQIVALIGPNGAGKSTLLRTLSGMIPPRSGEITFRGRQLAGLPIEDIVRVGISHIPEGRRLFPGLTVRDNLRLGGWRTGNTNLEPVLELFPRLAERLGQTAGSLSGGEQQMCAIARGLMSKPDIMMIDELSLGLAPLIVDEIMSRLPDVAASGTSVLIVEQDVDIALEVAEYGYVLETGHITLAGRVGELLADTRIRQAYLGQI